MGFIYVLTGPDHLSAIATIVGTSLSSKPCNSTRTWSFLLGIKWGIGNSIGLLIIGSILIATDSGGGGSGDEWIMIDDTNGLILEGFVGILLCLGKSLAAVILSTLLCTNEKSLFCEAYSFMHEGMH